MPELIDYHQEVETFRLVGPDPAGPPLPSERRWWRRESIYLSDVCLAVHLSPTVSTLEDDREAATAKEALYTYLRRVGQYALEHDLMRPVACVMSSDIHQPSSDLLAYLRSWGSDQEWHRGNFTLYVEIPGTEGEQPQREPYKRLADLLNPKPETLWLDPRETVTADLILGKLEAKIQDKPPTTDHAATLVRDLLTLIKNAIKDAPSQPQQGDLVESWKNEIIKQADNWSRGSMTR